MIASRPVSDQREQPFENTLISVIIAVYNGEKFLAQTLESVAEQTGFGRGTSDKGIEVIVIDDCSRDHSATIIERQVSILRQKGFSVRHIMHHQNAGSIPSYTEGALLVRGKYFKVLDHDDVLASERALAEPVEYMESMERRGCSVGAVFSKSLYIDAENLVFGEKRFPLPFLPLEARNGLIPKKWGRFVLAFSPIYPFVHGASVVRAQCWQELSAVHLAREKVGLFDVAFAIHVMHSRQWEVAYLRSPSLRYRIHTSNFTQGITDRKGWIDHLNGYYEDVYPQNCFLLSAIKHWNRCIQLFKSLYHSYKGPKAFESIKLFR